MVIPYVQYVRGITVVGVCSTWYILILCASYYRMYGMGAVFTGFGMYSVCVHRAWYYYVRNERGITVVWCVQCAVSLYSVFTVPCMFAHTHRYIVTSVSIVVYCF